MPPPSNVAAPAAPDPAQGRRLPVSRRLLALLGVALVSLVVIVAVLASGGSSDPPPATGAAALVPADTLVYVHLSTDQSRAPVRRMARLLHGLPDHGDALLALVQRIVDVVGGSTAADYRAGIRPWLGREAAFALLNTASGSAGSLTILDVRDRARALRFITRQGAAPAAGVAGAIAYQYPTGAELAFIGRYLVVGTDAAVHVALEVWHGQLRSLTSSPIYQRANAGAPSGRVLDAYAPAAGVLRLLDSRQGFLGALGALVSPPSLLGAELTVTPGAPGLVVRIHSVLDRATAAADTKRLRAFSPSLPSVLPAGSTLMIDARNLAALAPIVFGATQRIGLLSQVPDLLHRLGAALTGAGVDVRAFMSLFKGETAVALASGSGAPALVIVTRTDHEQAARETLASLEPALAALFSAGGTGGGQEPETSDVQAGGVTAHQVLLGPGLQVDFSVFHGLIVVATSVRGVADVAARAGTLDHSHAYSAVLDNRPDPVTSLGFATFSQLLRLGGQSGLAQTAGFQSLQPDLQRIRAVGLDSTGGQEDTTAELFLQIS